MADCPNYGCDSGWEERVDGLCGETFQGGGPAAIIFKCGTTLTASSTDAAALGTEIDAMITAGTATLMSNVLIEWGDPQEVTQDSYIAQTVATPATYDRTITIKDQAVTAENIVFWNSLNRKQIGGILIFEGTDNNRCTYINKAITIKGGRNFPNNALQFFNMTGAYRAKDDALIYDKPDGYFEA